MGIVSASLKLITTIWLPTMTTIASPHLRRQKLTQNAYRQLENLSDNIPVKKFIETAPNAARLNTRKPFHRSLKTRFDKYEAWKTHKKEHQSKDGNLVADPTEPLSGFSTVSQKQRTITNRIRSRHTKTAVNLHRWDSLESPTCPNSKEVPQDIDHLIKDIDPYTKLAGGFKPAQDYDVVFKSAQDYDVVFKGWIERSGINV